MSHSESHLVVIFPKRSTVLINQTHGRTDARDQLSSIDFRLLRTKVIINEHSLNFELLAFRATIIMALLEKASPPKVLKNYNECIIHFLDIENVNLTKEYLKTAWNERSYGRNHIFLANIGSIDQLTHLNISEIFDFQRLFIAISYKVCPLLKIR